jgi:hypothetical protein
MFEIKLLEIVRTIQESRTSSQQQAKEITKALRTSDKLLAKQLSQNTNIKDQLAAVQSRAAAEDKLLRKLASMLDDSIDKDIFIKDRIGDEVKEKALQQYVSSIRGVTNE